MRIRRFGLILFFGLAGCSTSDVVLREPPAGYVQNAGALVAAADWSRTENVTLELSEFRFEPAALVVRQGVPTRLTLRNVGDGTHTFVSEGLFKVIAAQKLVTARGEVANPYLERIELRAGEEKQLYFVPVTKGSYPFECSLPFHDVFGMVGRASIE